MRILAAIVTHNRCELLARCIAHVRAQRRSADRLLIINNASTDGTVEMLDAAGVEHLDQPNLGSAGGWNRAMKEALAGGFDAVWLMDDDGFPHADALGALVSSLGPGVVCASSVVLREDDRSRFVFPFPALDRAGLPVLARTRRKLPALRDLAAISPTGTYPFAHLFNGALVTRAAIETVGTVDDRFFMFGDEVDYFFRLRRAGAVISVLAAHHFHPDVTQRPLTSAKLYYYLKNTVILNRRYLDKAVARDLLTLGAGLTRFGRRTGWGALATVLLGRERALVPRAMLRGWRGAVGADFGG